MVTAFKILGKQSNYYVYCSSVFYVMGPFSNGVSFERFVLWFVILFSCLIFIFFNFLVWNRAPMV